MPAPASAPAPARCAPPALLLAPVAPCPACPEGRAGAVLVNGADYLLLYHAHGKEILGYRLVSTAGKVYDIAADFQSCDCPSAIYRQHACKHLQSLKALKEQGQLL